MEISSYDLQKNEKDDIDIKNENVLGLKCSWTSLEWPSLSGAQLKKLLKMANKPTIINGYFDEINNKMVSELEISKFSENGLIKSKNKYIAMWDTGATHMMVSDRVVIELSLEKIGNQRISHFGGSHLISFYYINVHLPGGRILNKIITGGGYQAKENSDIDIIIGIDVIKRGDLAISQDKYGKPVLSFRYPSQETIDFSKRKEDESEDPPSD